MYTLNTSEDEEPYVCECRSLSMARGFSEADKGREWEREWERAQERPQPPPLGAVWKSPKFAKRVPAALIGGAPRGTWPAANGAAAPAGPGAAVRLRRERGESPVRTRPGQRHRGTRDREHGTRDTGLRPAAAPRRPEPPTPSSRVVGAGAGGAGSGACEPEPLGSPPPSSVLRMGMGLGALPRWPLGLQLEPARSGVSAEKTAECP